MIWWNLVPAGVLCLAALTLAVIPSYAGMSVSGRRKYYAASAICTLAGAALLLMTVA